MSDLILLLLVLGGTALALVFAGRGFPKVPPSSAYNPAGTYLVLLIWIAAPLLVGSIAVSRLNGTYFAPGVPALLLLAGCLLNSIPINKGRLIASWTVSALLLFSYPAFVLTILKVINSKRFVEGVYYIPLVEQEKMARKAKLAGIPAGHIVHLSGDYYQRPYDYLHREVAKARPGTQARLPENYTKESPGPWLVMEDLVLRRKYPQRSKWLEQNLNERHGTVLYRIVPDQRDAEAAREVFYNLPMN
jgi:hypothetical protein